MATAAAPKKTPVKSSAPKKVAAPTKAPQSGLSLSVFDITGKAAGSVDLPKEIFDIEASPRLIAHYVKVYNTNQRQGTVSTKTRAMVQSSTRTIYRQKGTGRARHGAKSAPIFVGGGVAFGPQPREYHASINKKQRRRALFAALTIAFKNNQLSGLSDSALAGEPKTARVAGFLKSRDLTGKKTLLVLPKIEKNAIVMSSRNIQSIEVTDAQSLNAYVVLSARAIVFAESAVDILKNHFLKTNEN
ncbi:50S ribosomal protein L4 [Candidatus Microgenomates bacterium]|nr:50S ribosomal protein L4 [Candidatus Microgenomates bacterium]